MKTAFDVIVIGAGAVGSAAAYHAARAGHSVLLLEQFEIDHQHGSSYGHSRIIRYAYDHPAYIALARAAYPLWHDLEAEAGETLFTLSGGLDFGLPETPSLQAVARTLRATGIPHEILTAGEAMARFPQFRLPEAMRVIYQGDAGVLAASTCVRVQVRLAQAHGATVVANSPVTHVDLSEHQVSVTTPDATYSGGALLASPGAWGKMLFAGLGLDLPLTPTQTQENYFAAEPAADYAADRFPAFICHDDSRYGFLPYGLPSVGGSGLKVGLHGGPPITDVDATDRRPSEAVIADSRDFIRTFLPDAAGSPLVAARPCLYTMTPDQHFIIDTHPAYPNVGVSASCSGHAFKFSTLIGRILCDLVLTGQTDQNINLFRLSRFDRVEV